MRELQVFPQPLQKPHPQVWEPLTTERSIRWAAQRGVNGYFIVEPISRLRRNIDIYYEEAEKCGWPDRLGRGKFKYGWDCERRRGVMTGRYVHLTLPGRNPDRERQRFLRALELQWDYYGPFGFAAVLADENEPLYDISKRVSGETLLKRSRARGSASGRRRGDHQNQGRLRVRGLYRQRLVRDGRL